MWKGSELVLFVDKAIIFSSGSNAISLQDGVNLTINVEWLKVDKSLPNKKKKHITYDSTYVSLVHVYLYTLMEKRCNWRSVDRLCCNCIWVTNTFIAY